MQLTVDIQDAGPAQPACAATLVALVEGLVGGLGMHPIHARAMVEVGSRNRKDPVGLSGLAMIAESHVSSQSLKWPRFASMDICACQPAIYAQTVLETVAPALGARDMEVMLVPRRSCYPAEYTA